MPEESPAHCISDLRFWVGAHSWLPEEFFEYTPWFTNVERANLLEFERRPVSQTRPPILCRMPELVACAQMVPQLLHHSPR